MHETPRSPFIVILDLDWNTWMEKTPVVHLFAHVNTHDQSHHLGFPEHL